VRDTIRASLDEGLFTRWVDRLEGTTEHRIEGDVTKAIEVLSNRLSLTNDEQSSVLKHLIEGGDLTHYGLINAVTRTAEDAKSYDRATELEMAGAIVLDLNPTEWRELALAA
jgi:transcriptional regulator of NAD metabolism